LTAKTAGLSLTFRALAEGAPGNRLAQVWREYWPSYRRWIARAPSGTTVDEGERMLRAHMPELAPVYDRLREMAGDDPAAARFFSLWRPPPVVRGCSQAVWTDGVASALVRNYDHAPHLCDGVVLWSAWEGVRTVSVTDCLWGALDGVNEHGLCAALAFGGRAVVGEGFAASLVVRYILQTCATVREAIAVLRRVPVFMAYTFVLLDARGEFVTAYTGPDRAAVFEPARASANHQGRVEWPAYCAFVRSAERARRIQHAVSAPDTTRESLLAEFLAPPIYRSDYERGSGTIYTASYDPATRSLALAWPGLRETFSVDSFTERIWSVGYGGQGRCNP
jgi:predicted choloylglycine hydrolase